MNQNSMTVSFTEYDLPSDTFTATIERGDSDEFVARFDGATLRHMLAEGAMPPDIELDLFSGGECEPHNIVGKTYEG